MVETLKKLAGLSPEKRALLELRLKEQGQSFNTFPLSFAQERLWLIDQLGPGSPAYNIPIALQLSGEINLPAMERTVNEIVRRHEVLRTTYRMIDAGPVQAVSPVRTIRIPVVDLTQWPEAEREIETKRLVDEEAVRPFNLMTGPIFRVTLLQLDQQEHVLLLTMHHIASDMWSTEVLVREVALLYEAFSEGRPSPLVDLPIQYADFAVWQRNWLRGELLDQQLGYWKKQLAGAPPILALPADRPRPPVQTLRGDTLVMELSEELTDDLRELCKRENATLFMLMLAAFKVLLYRYTSQSDLVVGIPIANRNQVQTEDLIGFFVNTLALRTDLSGDPSFREVVRRVRETSLGAYAHQDLPFEKIVQELNPERNQSFAPLFQVSFGLQAQTRAEEQYELRGLKLRALETQSFTSKFDLVQKIVETNKGLTSYLHYNTDIFKEATIRRLATHFRQLLEDIVAHPDAQISQLSLLSEDERHKQLSEWNDTVTYPRHQTLHELFASQAGLTPEAIALVYEEEQVSYRELNERSNQLAHYLQGLGVGPESLVALCFERSVEMVVALLGVLKAGGAYLPLDPQYPQDRLAFMVKDARVSLLLTQTNLTWAGEQPRVIELEREWEEISQGSVENPAVTSTADNLAYVIYTSGSTGQPKGTLITHYNVTRLLDSTAKHFAFGGADVWTLFHSYAFDFSVWEIWGALAYGGKLVVVPYAISRSPHEFYKLLREHGVTVLNQTPSAFRQLSGVDAEEHAELALRLVIFGGEALEWQSLRGWFERHGDKQPQLINMYGITETTVHVTYREVSLSGLAEASVGSLIGEALDDLQLYLLTPQMQLLPVGVWGELYVGGAGLARGYLKRPELTAQRFVPNPFAGSGERLYRTGDVGRYRADGEIEYMGRADSQVKIRGFRIELGEIESVLSTHAAVRECVVTVVGEADDQRVVAYLVGENIDISQLRAHLKEKLPDYMVPAAFVTLPAMPLTTNGKLDRRALPAPDSTRSDSSFRAPESPLQRWLAERWCDVLHLDAIGIDEDFFDLGGDSIKAAIITNRLQQEMGEIIHVVTIFDASSVAAFAAYLEGQYPEAVQRLFGVEGVKSTAENGRVTVAEVEHLRALTTEARLTLPLVSGDGALGKSARLRPALFVLSAPRAGSTLMRVMLGGHSRLFAPPELELLGFRDMGQRRAALSGRDKFWLDGAIRAVMQARDCTADQAETIIGEYEVRSATTTEFYSDLQEWIGADRMLVDKTPSYAMELEVLRRAEQQFGGEARYIHLVRRPEAVINSYVEAHLEQIFPRFAHPYSGRAVAELVWDISQQNIAEFLKDVSAERQHRVVFEELVAEPQRVLKGVSEFLGLEYEAEMSEPYRERAERMTDGVRAESKMLGDIKFHEHRGIEAGVGERWRESARELEIGEVTKELAKSLGYVEPETHRKLVPVSSRREANQSQFPMSFAQERLWFLNQLEPDSAFYNISLAARLSGRLNLTALEQTLSEIVRRHEVLRTTFQFINRKPLQVVSPAKNLSLPITDLSDFTESERDIEVTRLITEDARQPFKLDQEPALRMSVVRLNEAEHVVLFTMHHIVADGWSMGVLVNEVAALYEAFSKGLHSPLADLPVQYADFAGWQRTWLQGEELDQQLGYWKRQLSGTGTPVLLPTDHPRPEVPKFHGASHSFTFSPELVEKVKLLSRKENVTLFMTLLAGLQTLLHRLTGETDITVGTDMAGRNRAEIENLIGFFINLLVMRVDISGDPSFRELLGRVRDTCLGAFEHQDLPFEKLVEELNPERSTSSTPLFSVLFVYQNAPQTTLELPGLQITLMPGYNETSKFDLALFIGETSEGIHGTWKYNSDLFNDSTLARLSRQLTTLIESAMVQPDARLSTLDMLTETEKQSQAAAQKKRLAANLERFKSIKPKTVSLSKGNLISERFLFEDSIAPLVIEPTVENFDLADWAAGRRPFIQERLLKHGALLFRGFNVKAIADFESFAKTQCQELFGEYGDLPREGVGGKVYGSTPYPSDQAILFHNESSHMHRWPRKIWFLCLKAAEQGGETPIVDCRKVYQALDPEIRARFAEKKLMYVRNYIEGLDVSWQSFFHTRDQQAVEEYCRKASIEFEWSNGNDLRTRKVCRAVWQHPTSGEDLFFNQIQLHHISCLNAAVRQSMRSDFEEKDFPRNVFYGDGSVIEDAVVDAIRETYQKLAVNFRWQPGDVLMLDNMLTAHGRNPFTGERKVVVALGDMIEQAEAEHILT